MELFENETALNCRTLSCEASYVMANSPPAENQNADADNSDFIYKRLQNSDGIGVGFGDAVGAS